MTIFMHVPADLYKNLDSLNMSGLTCIENPVFYTYGRLLICHHAHATAIRTEADYYRLLQSVRDADAWEDWVLYMLEVVEVTAGQTIKTIHAIKEALFDYKHRIRDEYKFYSQDLINNLFMHPYTKIEFIERDLGVSRLTASKYLDALAAGGFVQKNKIGRSNYYVNLALNQILLG
jgi:Fic family protein